MNLFASSPEPAAESQSDGVLSDSSTQRHSAGAEGEGEAEEGGRQSLAEQQRGQREGGEETEGQPGEERQAHRGKEQESVWSPKKFNACTSTRNKPAMLIKPLCF